MSQRLNLDGSERGYIDPNALVGDAASMSNVASVLDWGCVHGILEDDAQVTDRGFVAGRVRNEALVADTAIIEPTGVVSDTAIVCGAARVYGSVSGNAVVMGNAIIPEQVHVEGGAIIQSRAAIAYGNISTETWDAYSAWCPKNEKWYIALRIACQRRSLIGWTEAFISQHAAEINHKRRRYWEETIESLVKLAASSVVLPQDKSAPQHPTRRPIPVQA